MANLLKEPVDYLKTTTTFGTWRRYLYPGGHSFAEFRSHAELLGLPLLHYSRGICPETGRRIVAKGIIAVGRLAVGGIAIGQAAVGLIAIGQLGLGLLFALAQLATGYYALGQVALALQFGIGQLATGGTAVGQLAFGEYVLAQVGWGSHVWQQGDTDPEAVAYFKGLWASVQQQWSN